jgi:iron complex transport system substrate-binding protein
VTGGHSTCVFPPEAAFLEVFDYSGDPEQAIAAQPDLVLIRPFIRRHSPDYVEALEKSGLNVVSLYPESFSEFPGYIEKLALLTGTQERAQELLAEFYGALDDLQQKTSGVPKKTVFFEATETETRTVISGSMPDLAISMAGGINLAQDAKPMTEGSSISSFGVEKVLENAEKIDVYISQRGAMNSGGNLISIGERPGYGAIKAVRENRVYLINEKLISSPTFRYLEGVNEVARLLHPDLIDDLSMIERNALATRLSFAEIAVKSLHLQAYVPSSSKYYQTEQRGHTFGLFEDVSWDDPNFCAVETAVFHGYAAWDSEDGKERFHPEKAVTRDELARSAFIMGEFENKESHAEILDLDQCENQRIAQILVDNGVFSLEGGMLKPLEEVSNQEIFNVMGKVIESRG